MSSRLLLGPMTKSHPPSSLTLPDLQPNTGLWWYFFTEMFDHFRPFFLMVFSVRLSALSVYSYHLSCYRPTSWSTLHQLLSNFSKMPVSGPQFHPLTAIIRYDPLFATFILLGILGTFKPYATLSDPGLFFSMISIFPELYTCKHNIIERILWLIAL